jgi:hypothetical protein
MAGEKGKVGGKRSFSRMKAFLKRHWILLSCAVVLAPCSMVDCVFQIETTRTAVFYFGANAGYIGVASMEWSAQSLAEYDSGFSEASLHSPMFGSMPEGGWENDEKWFGLPLWLPLSAAIGWIAFRELRWREKRVRAEEATS